MFGLQSFIRNYLIDYFNEEFFGRPLIVIEDYKKGLWITYLGSEALK